MEYITALAAAPEAPVAVWWVQTCNMGRDPVPPLKDLVACLQHSRVERTFYLWKTRPCSIPLGWWRFLVLDPNWICLRLRRGVIGIPEWIDQRGSAWDTRRVAGMFEGINRDRRNCVSKRTLSDRVEPGKQIQQAVSREFSEWRCETWKSVRLLWSHEEGGHEVTRLSPSFLNYGA